MPGSSFLGIHDPWLGSEERAEIEAALGAGWLSGKGGKVRELEARLGDFFGAPTLTASSGSAALLLALRAAGVGSGDHVLVSDYGFVATANAVRLVGAEPVFLGPDSEDEPFVSFSAVRAFLDEEVDSNGCLRRTSRPLRGMLYNEPYGFSCPRLAELRELLGGRGLFLIEDASQAIGVRKGERLLGTFGHLGVFSFNGNKTLPIGAGGAITGTEAEWLRRASHLQAQARSDAFDFYYDEVGHNFLLPNVSAAVGVAQVKRLPEILRRKCALREEYARLLAPTPWRLAGESVSFPAWLNVVLAPRPLSRDQWAAFAGALGRQGIGVRPVFPAVTRNKPYAQALRFGCSRGDGFFARGLCLPSGPLVTSEDAARIVAAIGAEGAVHGIA